LKKQKKKEEELRKEEEERAKAEAAAAAAAAAQVQAEPEKKTLKINIQNEEDEVELGNVEIEEGSTLSDVRVVVASKLNVPKFAFLVEGVPLTKYEEANKLAVNCLPEITIRGADLTPQQKPETKFTTNTKASKFQIEEEKRKKEQEEFLNILNKVKAGYLRNVQKDLTK